MQYEFGVQDQNTREPTEFVICIMYMCCLYMGPLLPMSISNVMRRAQEVEGCRSVILRGMNTVGVLDTKWVRDVTKAFLRTGRFWISIRMLGRLSQSFGAL